MYEMFSYEREYERYSHICGIDRRVAGDLSGPVVAAAVILPRDCDILYLNDSKKVSPKREKHCMMKFTRKLSLSESGWLRKKS